MKRCAIIFFSIFAFASPCKAQGWKKFAGGYAYSFRENYHGGWLEARGGIWRIGFGGRFHAYKNPYHYREADAVGTFRLYKGFSLEGGYGAGSQSRYGGPAQQTSTWIGGARLAVPVSRRVSCVTVWDAVRSKLSQTKVDGNRLFVGIEF